MTRPKNLFKKFETLTHLLLNDLENYSEEEFHLSSNERQWPAIEVYNHIIQTNQNYFHVKIQDCLNKDIYVWPSVNIVGRLVFLINTLPAAKYKIPVHPDVLLPVIYSKTECRIKLLLVLNEIKLLTERLDKAHTYYKTNHPLFGMLNVFDWFQFMNIHMQQHFNEKKRLDRFLRTGTNVIFKNERTYQVLQKI